jgi:sarcosine oxidase, subunit alpha
MSPAPSLSPSISIDFEGRAIPAVPGEPVAVALLRAGERILARSVKYHRPRGIQCMQEHCASCLVRIDGLPNQFACTRPCADGLSIARQNAFPSASADLFRSIDWAFPKTFNHHEMLAGVPIASQVMAKVARQLAGLGELPAEPGAAFEPAGELEVGTAVIGLGRSGLGWLSRLEPPDLALEAQPLRRLSGDAPDGGDRIWGGARALGLYLEAGGPVLAVRRGRALWRVRPKRVVLCVGSRVQIPAFPGNELPGVMTEVAALQIARCGVTPGRRALVLGEPLRARETAQALRACGAEVTEADPESVVVRAKGIRGVSGAVLARATGADPRAWKGDVIAIAGSKAPAFELAAQAGAELTFLPDRGFAIRVDAQGRTSLPWLSAFGSCSALESPSGSLL